MTCNLCGSDDARPLYESRDWRLGVDDVSYSVVRCRRCGLGYLTPRPSPEAIGRYYPAAYFTGRGSGERARRLAAQAEYLAGRPPGRVLDVGCAGGEFMLVMEARGWTATGLEPHARSPAAPHLDIVASWEQLLDREGTFDAVTAWSVFEHLHDPMEGFVRSRDMLRPGGRVVVHVPNLRSLMSRWAYGEDVPRHLYFFTERTLRAYGERAGLDLVATHHDTRIMNGDGRGFLRAQAVRLAGGSPTRFREWAAIPGRGARARRRPLLFAVSVPLSALEWPLCAAATRRRLRVNGYVVAEFVRPG